MQEEFRLKQFTVRQSKNVFKITTDSVILGAYASFVNPRYLLDVGSGTGIIALMLAQKYPNSDIYAIDINPEAVALCRENFRRSQWKDRLHVLSGDFEKYDFGTLMFDGIVSNPPFFVQSMRSEDNSIALARHDTALTYRGLARKSSSILSPDGAVYVIVPYDNLRLLEREFNFEYLFCQKRLYICTKGRDKPKRVIVQFSRKIEWCQEEWLNIQEQNGYSKAYKALTKDFYINF